MDSASNNDTMVAHLAMLLDNFPRPSNQVRCFLHVLNLVTKSVLVQFDPPKVNIEDLLAEGLQELAALERDVEDVKESGREDDDEDDDVSDLRDEREDMTEVEVVELEASIIPVRLALTKVSLLKLRLNSPLTHLNFSFARLHSLSRIPPPSYCQNGTQLSKS